MNTLLKEFITEIMSLGESHSPGDVWKTVGGWGAQNKEKNTEYFKDKKTADVFAKGVDKKSADMSEKPKPQDKQKPVGKPTAPKSGRPRKPGPPDIDAVTTELGRKTIKDVNALIIRALKKGKKNPLIGGDGDQKLAVLSGLIKSTGQSVTATGPVHEVTIGLALDVLTRFPTLSDAQVTRLLTENIKKTKLGASLGPKLYETVHKAVMSAKAEKIRVELGIRKNRMITETTVTEHYHGNKQSKSKLITQMSKLMEGGYTVYTSGGTLIDPADVPLLIGAAGSSAHGDYITPGDTFVVSVDSGSKKIILSASSNKTTRNDQSLNTTVIKELIDYRSALRALVDSGALTEDELKKVEKQLKKTDDIISNLSSQVSDVFAVPVKSLQEKPTQKKFINFISGGTGDPLSRTVKNLPKYYEQSIKPFMEFATRRAKKIKMSPRDERILASLKATGWTPGKKISKTSASAAWIHDMQARIADNDPQTGLTGSEAKLVERFFANQGGANVDTTKIRMQALAALRSRHLALAKINCTLDGKELPVSSVVLGIFTARALHLEESLADIPGNSKVYTEYPCFFKAVTGDIVGYPKSNQAALGVTKFSDFSASLTLSKPKVAQRRGGTGEEKGTITFDIVSITKDIDGKPVKKSICARVIRTKGGTNLNIVAVPLRDYTDALAENQPKVPSVEPTV